METKKARIESHIQLYKQTLQEWLISGFYDESEFINAQIEKTEDEIKITKREIKFILGHSSRIKPMHRDSIPTRLRELKKIRLVTKNSFTNLSYHQIVLAFDEAYLQWLKNKKKRTDDPKLPAPEKYSEWFLNTDAYKDAMRLLVDNKLMNPKLKWDYFKADQKVKAASILKQFKRMGYYRKDIKITNDDFARIMQSWDFDIKNGNTGTIRSAIDPKKVGFITPFKAS